ncbi:MAG: isopentenyl-diphosphate Delta-isomerase [Chitinophagales bacterium]
MTTQEHTPRLNHQFAEPDYPYVLLVDRDGKVVGTEEKIKAHREGNLHRAFSVFIFNEKGEMLLQQRAFSKYHFGGLWSNSCCSHQKLNETSLQAAHRRLEEELGFDTELREVFSFIYRAEDRETRLIEHELDTVLVGFYDESFIFNSEEVQDVKWITIAELFLWLNREPAAFSYWFKTALLELKNKGLLSKKTILELFQ